MSDIINVENLVKVYPGGTRAVDGISFSVREGEFFGFLGPNGAGKSTTIQVLTTLLKKTSGSATVAGYDVDKDAREIRKVIGVQRQDTILDGDLTGRENLTLQGHLQRLHGNALKKRVDELLTLVELSDVADKRATSGLDPQSRVAIWEHLETLNRDEGVTIFLTTQQMEEADRLCHRLSIIDHGEIVVSGSPVELKHQLGGDTITLSLANGDSDGAKDRSKRIVSGVQGVTKVLDIETGLAAYAKNASALVPDIVRLFDENGIRLTSISVASASLDDVFLQHTGRRIRSEELSKVDTWKRHV